MADIDFNNHTEILNSIVLAQDNERERRQAAREAKLFLNARDGQWDPYAIEKLQGRYRGTFDMCTPIVDSISGEIDQSDFTLKISPTTTGASDDTAKTMEGLVRNIRNISDADYIFSRMSRNNVICGFDCLEIVQDWIDGDSFDQDLILKYVPNAIDAVWFDIDSMKQDRSDARWGVKNIKLSRAEYDKRWPEGSGMSITDDRQASATSERAEFVTVGQLYYKKSIDIEIVQMNDGAVYKADKYEPLKEELAAKGIEEVNRRTRKSWRVYSRIIDGGGFLQEEEETVFDYIPLVPIYGNYDVFENKPVYYGKLENLYDPQRVLNYAMSRDIEDGALSPSPAIWMTETQAEGHDYSTMNTDGDPVRFYNVDEQAPPISQASYVGGAQVSPGLQTTIALTKELITASANSFNALQGNAMPQQSGIAGAQQIDQANIGSIKWFEALKVTVCHVGKILVTSIPRVYDSTRQIRMLDEDGTARMTPINKPIINSKTGQAETLNDLSVGEYDVVCDFGPAFNSQQKETATAFLEMAQIDPSLATKGMDIWLKNLSVPGMDLMAERVRQELLNAGMIPQEQLTEEELQKIAEAQAAAANQPPQEDPMMVAARAEELKGQAEMADAQNKQMEIQGQLQLKQQELALKQAELELDAAKFERDKSDKFNVDAAKISQDNEKLELQRQNQQFQQQLALMKQQTDEMTAAFNNLKTMKDAMGADAIVGPNSIQTYKEQVDIIQDKQDDI